MRSGSAALVVGVVLLAGCAPPASRGTLDSDNPAAKLYAIRAAGDAGDRSAVPKLVESLDNDDPAIRMMAISALERLTGERLGYNPYAGPAERRQAVEAWDQAVRKGRFSEGAATKPGPDGNGDR
jgi:hypothetical protein